MNVVPSQCELFGETLPLHPNRPIGVICLGFASINERPTVATHLPFALNQRSQVEIALSQEKLNLPYFMREQV